MLRAGTYYPQLVWPVCHIGSIMLKDWSWCSPIAGPRETTMPPIRAIRLTGPQARPATRMGFPRGAARRPDNGAPDEPNEPNLHALSRRRRRHRFHLRG